MQVQDHFPTVVGDDGVADRPARRSRLTCVWSRNPESGALESTWIRVPDDAAWAGEPAPAEHR